MEPEEIVEINQMLSPKTKISNSTVNLIKTPRRLKVNIERDNLEVSNQSAACHDSTEVEYPLKPMVEIPSQKIEIDLFKDKSPEPEIKKRRRCRRTTKEDKPAVPLKKRSSSRSTKGKHSNYYLLDESDAKADTRQKNAVGVLNYNEESLLALAHDVNAKTNAIISNANGTPVPNASPIALPIQKPALGTPGTARKRVGGEGKVASLQRIMLELPNLCDPNVFTDILMKTYGSRFTASKVFECLKTSDLKEAVTKKFTPTELLALIQRNGNAIETLLTMASSEEVLHEVQSREELRNSEKLLNVVLKMKGLNNDNVVRTVLDTASVDAIVNAVNSRCDLKSSEKLFNLLLPNLPEKISEVTKKSVIKVLIEKFTTSELVDISHEAIRSSVEKYQKN